MDRFNGGAARDWSRLATSRELPPLFQGRKAPRRRGDENSVALAEYALHVVGIDVGMTCWNVVLLTGGYHSRHRFLHRRMIVLSRIAQFLAQISFTNEYRSNPGNLL